ncbi:MAG: LysE family translocator [Rhodospirillales bacterium]|jgi:threonine/homoserine/homoserine lactone efflux protein|nr:LysE family translocator [Rhodospirillales bacterium]MBT4040472.1 LysE family translocator [Rhodospirillales bacterium]MBT4627033.1 LysE family translocator [Rhodospirillales bacterium]MBT5350758.1 LysE family translocator [Rhodospirillales bacterium]MBT5521401.1 LysE family translocator [Rhodospirillales bacterium]
MTLETAIALGLACFILMVAPGPGTLATVGRGMAHGFKRTLAFILGIVAGDLVYLTFSFVGLSALAGSYGELFSIVRWVGAVYLIYLGIKAWRAEPVPLDPAAAPDFHAVRDFLGGLMLTLGNPKVILFYTAFLPTFVDLGTISHMGFLAMAAIVTGVLFFTMVGYAWAADRSRGLFRSTRAVRILNRVSGAVLVSVGVVVAMRQQ